MPKNAIFGRFSCSKFFPGKNFKIFFLILIKGSITVSLIPISKSVYPGQQNIAFFGGMQLTDLRILRILVKQQEIDAAWSNKRQGMKRQ